MSFYLQGLNWSRNKSKGPWLPIYSETSTRRSGGGERKSKPHRSRSKTSRPQIKRSQIKGPQIKEVRAPRIKTERQLEKKRYMQSLKVCRCWIQDGTWKTNVGCDEIKENNPPHCVIFRLHTLSAQQDTLQINTQSRQLAAVSPAPKLLFGERSNLPCVLCMASKPSERRMWKATSKDSWPWFGSWSHPIEQPRKKNADFFRVLQTGCCGAEGIKGPTFKEMGHCFC